MGHGAKKTEKRDCEGRCFGYESSSPSDDGPHHWDAGTLRCISDEVGLRCGLGCHGGLSLLPCDGTAEGINSEAWPLRPKPEWGIREKVERRTDLHR